MDDIEIMREKYNNAAFRYNFLVKLIGEIWSEISEVVDICHWGDDESHIKTVSIGGHSFKLQQAKLNLLYQFSKYYLELKDKEKLVLEYD